MIHMYWHKIIGSGLHEMLQDEDNLETRMAE